MTSTEDLQTVYKCLKAGADHYLLKPLKDSDLRTLWQTIYKKREEMRVLTALDKEKQNSSILLERSRVLEDEIATLKGEIGSAVENTVRVISQQVEALHVSTEVVPANVILSSILKQLKRVDLYQPAFAKFVMASETEPVTKRWLIDQ